MMPTNMAEDQLKPALDIGVSVSEYENMYNSLTEKLNVFLQKPESEELQGRICQMRGGN